MRYKSKNTSGFTFVEVLVAVAVVAILATVAYGPLGDARKNGRDTQRINDIKQLQLAFRLYRDEFESYPTGYDDGVVIGEDESFDAIITPFVGDSIHDPLSDSGDARYEYVYDSDFDCSVAGNGKKVLYVKSMEKANAGNWGTVCGTEVSGATITETYGIILQ